MTSIEKLKTLPKTKAVEIMITDYHRRELDVLIDKWLWNPSENSLRVLLASIDCSDEFEQLDKFTEYKSKVTRR